MRAGSLFTGGGGLDLAVQQLFPEVEWAWHAEQDKHAARLLERHWPDVPNLGDLSKVDWTKVPPVELLVGGYPCQPWSNAGKRKGQADVRDGWPWFRDAVRHLGPRWVLLENVAGHVVPDGAGRTVGDLSALGYDCRWAVVRASDVGATHHRARWFCVAYDPDRAGRRETFKHNGGGAPQVDGTGISDEPDRDFVRSRPVGVTLLPTPRAQARDHVFVREGGNRGNLEEIVGEIVLLSPAQRATLGGSHTETQALLPTPKATSNENRQTEGQYGPNLGEAIRSENGAQWGDYAEAIHRWEQIIGRQAPAPTDVKGRLSPEFVEWMMGWPAGWTEPLTRTQRLKVLGNGVVPLQAVHAYGSLLQAVPA